MSVTSGFFNSINGDRLYDATQMSSIFDGIIHDGIYESYGDHFAVTPGSSGLSVIVGTGRAWFNHTWTLNNDEYPLYLDAADTNAPRIDAVILKVNATSSVRENTIEVIKGEAATHPIKPTWTDGQYIHHYPLAYVTVPARATDINTANIENAVGIAPTVFALNVLEHIDATELISQWWDQWGEYVLSKGEEADAWYEQFQSDANAWIAEQQSEFTSWVSGFESDAEEWIAAQQASYISWKDNFEDDASEWFDDSKAAFDDWFANLHYILDGDVAGHLQNEIDEHAEKLVYSQNGVHGLRYDTTEETLMAEDSNGNEHDVGISWLKVVNGVPSIVITTN